MQGMSEREYAARAGLSRGAIQKAKAAGRLVLHPDGSIDPEASDARRAAATDPSKQRAAAERAPAPKLKPVPAAALSAVGDTLREHGLPPPPATGGATFLRVTALRAAIARNADRHATDLAPVVENIRAGGATSMRAIAAELNARGMLTRRGGRWHVSTVTNLLDRLGLRKAACASPG